MRRSALLIVFCCIMIGLNINSDVRLYCVTLD
jgi:hypothetical protein